MWDELSTVVIDDSRGGCGNCGFPGGETGRDVSAAGVSGDVGSC